MCSRRRESGLRGEKGERVKWEGREEWIGRREYIGRRESESEVGGEGVCSRRREWIERRERRESEVGGERGMDWEEKEWIGRGKSIVGGESGLGKVEMNGEEMEGV